MESRAIGPKFCTALRDNPRYVCAKYYRDLCKIEGARSGTKIPVHILDTAAVAAAASNQSNTYRSHTSRGT